MLVGEDGLGKSTLINTLFNKEIFKKKILDETISSDLNERTSSKVRIKVTNCEIEEDGVNLNLNVITTPGFGENINNNDSWNPIIDEINDRFDLYLEAESRINRSTIVDERIHVLLYFIEPTGHYLRALDIKLMKAVHNRVNLIPIIAKSDILGKDEIIQFKKKILQVIKHHGIKTFKPLDSENDEELSILKRNHILSHFPLAVVGLMKDVETEDGRIVKGRHYPWGTVEVENENHNDFVMLRQLIIKNYLEELKEYTSNVLYENYRTEKLKLMGIEQDNSVFKDFDPFAKQEEERLLHESKLAKLESEMKAVFQQKVSEKEKKLQKSEADLFSRHKEMKDKLLKQINLLEEKKVQLEKQKLVQQDQTTVSTQKTRKGFLR